MVEETWTPQELLRAYEQMPYFQAMEAQLLFRHQLAEMSEVFFQTLPEPEKLAVVLRWGKGGTSKSALFAERFPEIVRELYAETVLKIVLAENP